MIPTSEGCADSAEGDVVGCGIDFTSKQAFYTKNGKFIGMSLRLPLTHILTIGYRFKDLGEGLHPAIGLRTPHESIAVNFTGPFRYDIDNYVRNVRDKTWRNVITPRILRSPDLTAQGAKDKEKKTVDSEANSDRSIPTLLGDHAITELQLPPSSVLADSAEKTAAAFVLDYLRHEGHTQALGSVRSSMHKRGWIKATPSAEPPVKEDHNELSTIKDFSSAEACIAWIRKRIIEADALPIVIPLLRSVLDEKDMVKAEIHHYLYLLCQAHGARRAGLADDPSSVQPHDTSSADEADMKVLQCGQELKKKSEKWGEDDKAILREAFGLLSVDPDQWGKGGIGGRAQREKDADHIASAIRGTLSLAPRSLLHPLFLSHILLCIHSLPYHHNIRPFSLTANLESSEFEYTRTPHHLTAGLAVPQLVHTLADRRKTRHETKFLPSPSLLTKYRLAPASCASGPRNGLCGPFEGAH
jgi:hypothetical protein